ncbi:MAG: SLC13/DASS family transporter [Bacteroidales bacterium]|nr:SLC13/DASS family transporter [Bacteroidales bacterium]
MDALTWQGWATIAVTIGVFTLALTTKIKPYVIFMGATTMLMLLGILTPNEAVSGFGDTSVIIAGVLFVVVAGLEYSGMLQWLVKHLMKPPKNVSQGIVGIMLPSAFFSSFLSNTSVVAILMNVVKIWCKKRNISPGKLLIPLSYAAGTGGTLTLIGSPSTLIIAGLYEDKAGTPFGFFDATLPAFCCLIVCILTVLLLQKLLPEREMVEEDDAGETTVSDFEIASGRRTLYAAIILVVMIALPLAKILPLLTSCLLAAFAMVIFKCCTVDQGYKGIKWQVMIIWASSIALGKALDDTGVAAALANGLVGLFGKSPLAILCAICLVGTFITEFVSNTAAAALLFPVMSAAITPLGLPLLPFTVALMISVTCSFATPIGSPTHMLIYGPGNYRFTDFIKIGLPMNIIMLAVNVLSVYLLFF